MSCLVPFRSENIKIAYLKLHLASSHPMTDRWMDGCTDRYWIFNPDGIGKLEMVLWKMQMAPLHPHSTRCRNWDEMIWNENTLHYCLHIRCQSNCAVTPGLPSDARDETEIEIDQLHRFNHKCECDAMHGCSSSNIPIALILSCSECVHCV